ncbi:MAG TPA: type II secretion system minor pseudopilin GspK [Burkholderiaceae bacterium]|nr:type II secretion system minor pseudopilin GspK [Burkholderiaceae bacterium]
MRSHRPPAARGQRGVAVLLALFIVAIATLIVTDLFWRQFVLFRTIENQQNSSQARLLLHGAQDWARSILQDQTHPGFDALSDPWAQPLAQTRLDQLGETAPIASQASLEGQITDAQARFNLRNLLDSTGAINPVQLAILQKLATLLSAPEGTAQLIAGYVAQAYAGGAPAATASLPAAASASGALAAALVVPLTNGARPIPPVFPEDLAAVPGIDPAAAQTLAPFVILLDQSNTPVNFNTAGPELMAATIPELTISDANALAAERDRAYFISVGDIQNRLRGHGGAFPTVGVSTNSQYFIVDGTIRIQNAATRMRALVRRYGSGPQGNVQVLWEREQ